MNALDILNDDKNKNNGDYEEDINETEVIHENEFEPSEPLLIDINKIEMQNDLVLNESSNENSELKDVENDIFRYIKKLVDLTGIYTNYSKNEDIKSYINQISEDSNQNEVNRKLQLYIQEFEEYISILESKRDKLSYLYNTLKDKSLLLEDNPIAIQIINEIDILINDRIELHTIEEYDNYINNIQSIYDSIDEYITKEHSELITTLMTNISMCVSLYPHYDVCDEINTYMSSINVNDIKENEYEEYYNMLSNYISKYNEYIWSYTIERDKIVEQIDEIMKKYDEEISHHIIPTDLNIILQSQEMINKKLTKYTIEEYDNHYNDLMKRIDELDNIYINYKSNIEILKEKINKSKTFYDASSSDDFTEYLSNLSNIIYNIHEPINEQISKNIEKWIEEITIKQNEYLNNKEEKKNEIINELREKIMKYPCYNYASSILQFLDTTEESDIQLLSVISYINEVNNYIFNYNEKQKNILEEINSNFEKYKELKDYVECENPSLIEIISDYINNKPTNISIEEYEENSMKLDDVVHNMKEVKDIFNNRKKDVLNEISVCKDISDSDDFSDYLNTINEEINNIRIITEHSVHLLNHKLADILRYKRKYYSDDKNLLVSLYNILSEEYPHYPKIPDVDEHVNSIMIKITQEKQTEPLENKEIEIEKDVKEDDEKEIINEKESEEKNNQEKERIEMSQEDKVRNGGNEEDVIEKNKIENVKEEYKVDDEDVKMNGKKCEGDDGMERERIEISEEDREIVERLTDYINSFEKYISKYMKKQEIVLKKIKKLYNKCKKLSERVICHSPQAIQQVKDILDNKPTIYSIKQYKSIQKKKLPNIISQMKNTLSKYNSVIENIQTEVDDGYKFIQICELSNQNAFSMYISEFVLSIPKNEIIKDSDILNVNYLYKNFIKNRDIIIPNEIDLLKDDFIRYYECFSFIPFKGDIQSFIKDKLENIEMNEYVGITEEFIRYIKKTECFINEYNDKRCETIDNIINTIEVINNNKERVEIDESDTFICKDLIESLETIEEYSNEDLMNILNNGVRVSNKLISLDNNYNESFQQIDKELEYCHSIIHDNDKDVEFFTSYLDSVVIPSLDNRLINQNIIDQVDILYKEVKQNKEQHMKLQINSLSGVIENKLKEYPHNSHEEDILRYINELNKNINWQEYNAIYEKLNYINERIDNYIDSYSKSKDELLTSIEYILESYESKYKNYQKYVYDVKNIKEFVKEKSNKYSIKKYKENYYRIRDILNDMNDMYMVYKTKVTSIQCDISRYKETIQSDNPTPEKAKFEKHLTSLAESISDVSNEKSFSNEILTLLDNYKQKLKSKREKYIQSQTDGISQIEVRLNFYCSEYPHYSNINTIKDYIKNIPQALDENQYRKHHKHLKEISKSFVDYIENYVSEKEKILNDYVYYYDKYRQLTKNHVRDENSSLSSHINELKISKSNAYSLDEYTSLLIEFGDYIESLESMLQKYNSMLEDMNSCILLEKTYCQECDELNFVEIAKQLTIEIEKNPLIDHKSMDRIDDLYSQLTKAKQEYLLKIIDMKSQLLYSYALSYYHYPHIALVQNFLQGLNSQLKPEKYMSIYKEIMDNLNEFQTYIDCYNNDRNEIIDQIKSLKDKLENKIKDETLQLCQYQKTQKQINDIISCNNTNRTITDYRTIYNILSSTIENLHEGSEYVENHVLDDMIYSSEEEDEEEEEKEEEEEEKKQEMMEENNIEIQESENEEKQSDEEDNSNSYSESEDRMSFDSINDIIDNNEERYDNLFNNEDEDDENDEEEEEEEEETNENQQNSLFKSDNSNNNSTNEMNLYQPNVTILSNDNEIFNTDETEREKETDLDVSGILPPGEPQISSSVDSSFTQSYKPHYKPNHNDNGKKKNMKYSRKLTAEDEFDDDDDDSSDSNESNNSLDITSSVKRNITISGGGIDDILDSPESNTGHRSYNSIRSSRRGSIDKFSQRSESTPSDLNDFDTNDLRKQIAISRRAKNEINDIFDKENDNNDNDDDFIDNEIVYNCDNNNNIEFNQLNDDNENGKEEEDDDDEKNKENIGKEYEMKNNMKNENDIVESEEKEEEKQEGEKEEEEEEEDLIINENEMVYEDNEEEEEKESILEDADEIRKEIISPESSDVNDQKENKMENDNEGESEEEEFIPSENESDRNKSEDDIDNVVYNSDNEENTNQNEINNENEKEIISKDKEITGDRNEINVERKIENGFEKEEEEEEDEETSVNENEMVFEDENDDEKQDVLDEIYEINKEISRDVISPNSTENENERENNSDSENEEFIPSENENESNDSKSDFDKIEDEEIIGDNDGNEDELKQNNMKEEIVYEELCTSYSTIPPDILNNSNDRNSMEDVEKEKEEEEEEEEEELIVNENEMAFEDNEEEEEKENALEDANEISKEIISPNSNQNEIENENEDMDESENEEFIPSENEDNKLEEERKDDVNIQNDLNEKPNNNTISTQTSPVRMEVMSSNLHISVESLDNNKIDNSIYVNDSLENENGLKDEDSQSTSQSEINKTKRHRYHKRHYHHHHHDCDNISNGNSKSTITTEDNPSESDNGIKHHHHRHHHRHHRSKDPKTSERDGDDGYKKEEKSSDKSEKKLIVNSKQITPQQQPPPYSLSSPSFRKGKRSHSYNSTSSSSSYSRQSYGSSSFSTDSPMYKEDTFSYFYHSLYSPHKPNKTSSVPQFDSYNGSSFNYSNRKSSISSTASSEYSTESPIHLSKQHFHYSTDESDSNEEEKSRVTNKSKSMNVLEKRHFSLPNKKLDFRKFQELCHKMKHNHSFLPKQEMKEVKEMYKFNKSIKEENVKQTRHLSADVEIAIDVFHSKKMIKEIRSKLHSLHQMFENKMELYEVITIPRILINPENHLLIKGENLEYQSDETLKNVCEAIDKLLSDVDLYQSKRNKSRKDIIKLDDNKNTEEGSLVKSISKKYKMECKNGLITKIKRILEKDIQPLYFKCYWMKPKLPSYLEISKTSITISYLDENKEEILQRIYNELLSLSDELYKLTHK